MLTGLCNINDLKFENQIDGIDIMHDRCTKNIALIKNKEITYR